MAAVTGATTATSAVHHINSELIERAITFAVQAPHVWQALTYSPDLRGANTSTYAHPMITRLTASAAYTETDQPTAVEVARTQATITTAEYIKATFLGDRAKRLSIAPEEAIAVSLLVDACNLQIETAVLTLAASMTNTQGGNATVNTVVNFNSVISNFRAQIGSSSALPVMCMGTSAIRDLHEDSATNAAAIYGSMIGVQLHEATGGVNQGLRKQFGGIYMVETASVVAGDTTGKSNFITLVGGATETALMVPIAKDITFEVARKGDRVGSWLVTSHEQGAGIIDNARCRVFITRA